MPAKKGTMPPNAGKGRPVGAKNKTGAEIKEMIEGALSDVGGREYLARQAKENPVAFMGLIGKILPKDVNHGGQIDNPISIREIILRPLSKTDDATSA